MAEVSVQPLPTFYRQNNIRPELWRGPPPLFDGGPTHDDMVLALALIEALDDDSRSWYGAAEARLREFLRYSRGAVT